MFQQAITAVVGDVVKFGVPYVVYFSPSIATATLAKELGPEITVLGCAGVMYFASDLELSFTDRLANQAANIALACFAATLVDKVKNICSHSICCRPLVRNSVSEFLHSVTHPIILSSVLVAIFNETLLPSKVTEKFVPIAIAVSIEKYTRNIFRNSPCFAWGDFFNLTSSIYIPFIASTIFSDRFDEGKNENTILNMLDSSSFLLAATVVGAVFTATMRVIDYCAKAPQNNLRDGI